MEHIRDEALSRTDTAIELHGSHLHIMKKSLRRMKKHPDVEKWTKLYEVLEANNERKKKNDDEKFIKFVCTERVWDFYGYFYN